ncbi:ABC transporter ATP-binding protein/permease [Actinomycetaceae bacterium TAE3-ERU4]|nr:ABC transporter ATP-binding protein/permease [Actinomycetaceae bacterium TAE3-ERU4]
MLFELLRKYSRPYWAAIVLVIFLQITQTLANLWLPTLNARIIDRGVVVGNTGNILFYGLIMLLLTGGQLLASLSAFYYGARTGTLITHDIRRDTFNSVQKFSRTEVHRFEVSSLITRATNDIQQVQSLTIMGLTFMIMSPLIGIGGIIMAILQDAKLSLLFLVAVPVLALIMGVLMWRIQPLFKVSQERTDKINSVLREQISGVRVIRAFVRQAEEEKRFQVANQDLRDVNLTIGKLFALMFPSLNFIIALASVSVIWFGAIRIDSGGMEVGAMIAFINYLTQIFFSVMMLSFMFMMIPRAEVCAQRINEILQTKAVISNPDTPLPLPAGNNSELTFSLSNVSVQYPGAQYPVVENLNLELKPGTTTAIIGSTGSGKSTLAALFARLIDPSSGEVQLNQTNIRNYDLEDLRQLISFVPQKSYLFSGTVASTVSTVPNAQITPEIRQRVSSALEISQAKEFVDKLEKGLDSTVESGGTNFSGGQRQRLAIARALYRDAALYIFDDSFSALDYVTEAKLRAALKKRTAQAAVLIIAQRVNSIKDAEQILVLDAGNIVGRGKHEELLSSCPTYREIVASQEEKEVADK